jgi:hypothetical protein
MSVPTPPGSPELPPQPPMKLVDSMHALARLNDKMTELNAKLEYLRLLLKLGVK